jgi:GNAT superfamily N-acetyltransferase
MQFATPTADELKLVFDSWANSFRKSPWAGCIPNHLYDQVSREVQRSIMDRGARVLVAVTPIEGHEAEFPEVRRVMGYSVSEPERGILHFLYVKAPYRGIGVGRALKQRTVIDFSAGQQWTYTFRTRASERFLNSDVPGVFRWDPVPARVK